MIYLNDKIVKNLNLSWNNNIQVISDAIQCIYLNDIAQPIKPYLRYNDNNNRIIAMPAFLGGNINKAGIKWIASFPNNLQKGFARANSVTILNESDTGIPIGIINSSSISGIRTASVSGFMIKQFIKSREVNDLKIGIVGFGPIGQYHLDMIYSILKDVIDEIFLYDLFPINRNLINEEFREKITLVENWEQAYSQSDIFVTCTVSKERYINKEPKPGSLHLNVSLRDYLPDVFPYFANGIVVDSWEEICRENTDIELFHKTRGLQKEDVKEIQDLLIKDYFSFLCASQAIMFNPMGMAVFDIAMANYFLQLAQNNKVGILLD